MIPTFFVLALVIVFLLFYSAQGTWDVKRRLANFDADIAEIHDMRQQFRQLRTESQEEDARIRAKYTALERSIEALEARLSPLRRD